MRQMRIREIFLEKNKKTAYNYHKNTRGDDPVRVAICDDEIEFRKSLRQAIDASDTLPQDVEISEYSDGTTLINSHSKSPYDIIFLDIQMSGLSGIEAGHEIRNTDRNVIIIFLTSHKQFVFQSFKIEAFDYLVKPVDDTAVNEVLHRALKKHREQHYIVNFSWQEQSYALDVSDIIYLESDLRHVIFVTNEGEYKCVGKLNDYESCLLPYGFLRCHKSYLVNMRYIKSIEDRDIFSTNGHRVDMSTRKKQDCLRAFNVFLAKHRI